MSINCNKSDSSLQKVENSELVEWLNTLHLSRPKKRIHRDFADGYLCAVIVKKHYSHLIDLHNYTPTFKYTAKINNWRLLKSKVFKRLNIHITEKTMEDIANCIPGAVDNVLMDLKNKIKEDFSTKKDDDTMSSDESWYDVEVMDDNCDIMIIPIRKKLREDEYEIHKKKVISYEVYDGALSEISEKNEAIEIMKKKVQHLENLLKTKDNHIDELQKSITKKTLRSRKNEMSLLDTKPENLDSILELNYTSRMPSDEALTKPLQDTTITNDLINLDTFG